MSPSYIAPSRSARRKRGRRLSSPRRQSSRPRRRPSPHTRGQIAVLPCAIQPCTAQPRTPRVKPSSPVFPTQAQASGLARKRWSTRRAHAHGRSTRGRRQIRWKQPAHSAAADAAYQVPVASLPDPGTASDIARKGRSNRRAHAHGSSTRGRRQIRWRQPVRDSASADAAYRVAVTSLPDTGAGLKPSTEAQEYQASPRPRAQHARRPDGGSVRASQPNLRTPLLTQSSSRTCPPYPASSTSTQRSRGRRVSSPRRQSSRPRRRP
ncbi:hypothetical protein JB92DRAFT_2138159 [Gautieria morchelliformis]|nr:hypothetical protein JB92DRAFT_2138159 [Gautieria morchelliformis]